MKTILTCICFLLTTATLLAAEPARREWTVDGVAREAMVYAPESAKTQPTPLLFVFHGHGGRMQLSVRRYAFHEQWPEAIVVCPQGLNTPGALTDPEGKKPGWQSRPGHMEDRDLKFFDAMLASLRKDYRVDDQRIYSTGHSNGGGFTYLLWATRGDTFAAIAPTAAFLSPRIRADLQTLPVLHLAGEADPLVKFAWQENTIAFLREHNQCGEGAPWGEHGTRYPSKVGADVVTYIHAGGHEYPAAATPVIVKFLQGHAKP